jgi:hypothetical protein
MLQKCLMGIAFIQKLLNFFEMLWVMVIVYVFKINIRGVCCDRIIIKDYLIVHENSFEHSDPICALENRFLIVVCIMIAKLFDMQNFIVAYILLCVYHHLC